MRMRNRNQSGSSRRPEALADVCPVITPEAANLADIRIRLRDGFIERSRDTDDIGNAMACRHESTVGCSRDFVPPHVTIKRRGDFHRQPRPADLHVRITIAGERYRATEVAALDELNLKLPVLRRAQ